MRPAFPKMPTAPSAFSMLGAPQVPGDDPPKWVKDWGEGLLRPREISRYRDTLGQICDADNTVGRSATRHLERCQTEIDLRYLLHAPPNGQVWHKAFFRWVRAQGRSPHAPSIPKNANGPVGIPLIIINTAGRSATQQLERCQTDIYLRYLMHTPPHGHVWHKAFFGWDRAQGRSPHAPGVCQKCPRPRRHSPC